MCRLQLFKTWRVTIGPCLGFLRVLYIVLDISMLSSPHFPSENVEILSLLKPKPSLVLKEINH